MISWTYQKSSLQASACREILDGPDGWAIGLGLKTRSVKRAKCVGWDLSWIIVEEIIGPIMVEDGVKFRSKGYCEFPEDHFMLWYRNLNSEVHKKLVFQQGNTPWHAFMENMGWLANQGFSDKKLGSKRQNALI